MSRFLMALQGLVVSETEKVVFAVRNSALERPGVKLRMGSAKVLAAGIFLSNCGMRA